MKPKIVYVPKELFEWMKTVEGIVFADDRVVRINDGIFDLIVLRDPENLQEA